MSARAKLMIADSEHNADMLYVAGMFVPDPFIAVGLDDGWHGLLSPLEVDRARRCSRFDHVHLDTPWREQGRKLDEQGGLAATAAAFLRDRGVTSVTVPDHFPLADAERLRRLGFTVAPVGGPMFPERAVKSAREIAELRKAERLTRQAMRAAERFLAEAGVGNDGVLRHPDSGARLKSAHVRAVIETFLIAHGATPSHTIVACGRESADPHQEGRGLIRAGQPIIIDIFPRLTSSGYWGDMTRTYVKGRASSELKRLYRTVREGQDIGLGMIRDGAHGAEIHAAIQRHFDAAGFPTG
ncbi:MAG: aminopeptidase P family protein, partial [Planctomycetota bacterium]